MNFMERKSMSTGPYGAAVTAGSSPIPGGPGGESSDIESRKDDMNSPRGGSKDSEKKDTEDGEQDDKAGPAKDQDGNTILDNNNKNGNGNRVGKTVSIKEKAITEDEDSK